VLQPYFVEDKSGSPMQPLSPRPTGRDAVAQPAKQSSAFPPNYVHSLDATHMMMTATECHARGLAFAGVHDSFWTHAADVDICRDVIREQFVELYKAPLLERLKVHLEESAAIPPDDARHTVEVSKVGQEAHEQISGDPDDEDAVEIAPVPTPGNFDLEEVKRSTYFFN
jgi:DNA-directed RNA polymerase, mitochondrial